MTHRTIRTGPDGERIYADGHRYRPVPDAQRVNQSRRPDHPEAVRFHTKWFLPLDLLPDRGRQMPETRPDELILEHRAWCPCEVCQRPEAQALWRRRHGLRSGSATS